MFPGHRTELAVGRPASCAAVRAALDADGLVLALAQRDPYGEEPGSGGYRDVGCVTHVALLEATDVAMRLAAIGIDRARIRAIASDRGYHVADAEVIEAPDDADPAIAAETVMTLRAMVETMTGAAPDPALPPGALVDRIVGQLALDAAAAQWFLETLDVRARVERVLDPGQLAFEDARAIEARSERSSIVRWLFGKRRR
jgi:ATP-dependent Lon protease